jgi:hypothetical protein
MDGRLMQHYSQNVPTRARNSIMGMQQAKWEHVEIMFQ